MGWKIVDGYDVGLAHHHGALYAVAQLPHIAGPGVIVQDHSRLGLDRLDVLAVFPRKLADEGGHEQRDILLALAQRRNVDVHHIEPVVQILPELPLFDCGLELPVGGRDDPGIHFDGFLSPHPFEGLVLQHAQQLDLYVLADLTDLVQEDRAHVGQLEASPLAGHRSGERPPFVAEQLAFQKGFGEGGAVHLDQRLVLARGIVVEGVGDHLLADPALPGYQDRSPAGGDLLHDFEDLLHRLALADDVGELVPLLQLLLQSPVLEHQLPGRESPLDQQREAIHVHGLGQIVVGAVLHGGNRVFYRPVPGQDDHRQVR